MFAVAGLSCNGFFIYDTVDCPRWLKCSNGSLQPYMIAVASGIRYMKIIYYHNAQHSLQVFGRLKIAFTILKGCYCYSFKH